MVETKPLLLTRHSANGLLQSASHQKLPEKLITGTCKNVNSAFTAFVTRKSTDIIFFDEDC